MPATTATFTGIQRPDDRQHMAPHPNGLQPVPQKMMLESVIGLLNVHNAGMQRASRALEMRAVSMKRCKAKRRWIGDCPGLSLPEPGCVADASTSQDMWLVSRHIHHACSCRVCLRQVTPARSGELFRQDRLWQVRMTYALQAVAMVTKAVKAVLVVVATHGCLDRMRS